VTKLMKDMNQAERDAVEVDKGLWLEALKMYKKWGKERLKSWLDANSGSEKGEDMRRRLNEIRTNNKRK